MPTLRTTILAALVAVSMIATSAHAQPAPDKAPEDEDKDKAPERADPPAPSPEQMEKAKAAYLIGKELFDASDFKGAVKQFKESYRLSRNPLLLYNIGFTLDELDDKDLALFYYKKFLTDAPDTVPNRDAARERMKKLPREIAKADEGKTEPGDKTSDGKTGDDKTGDGKIPEKFQHMVVDEAPPGVPLDITAFVPEGSKWRVKLYFRAGGAKYTVVDMRPRYNELVGRIPAAAMRGTSIQYYVEARDANGKLMERVGRSTSPNLVLIEESAKPRYYPDLTDNRDWVPPSGGGGASGGGGSSSGDGSWTDIHSTKFQYLKWGATGGAIGMLAIATTSFLISADASSTLEGEAFASRIQDMCPTMNPCRAFSDKQKDLQSRGENFELIGNVALGLGAVSAAAASFLWYWEIKHNPEGNNSATALTSAEASSRSSSDAHFTATPVVTDDFVGGAAMLRF